MFSRHQWRLLSNKTSCMHLSFVKFAFRLLVQFSFVNSENFSGVVKGLESNSRLTRRQIVRWLLKIAAFKRKNQRQEVVNSCRAFKPSNTYCFGKTFGKYLDAACDPCACRLKETGVGCGVLEEGKCGCLKIIEFVNRYLLKSKREPYPILMLTGWQEKRTWTDGMTWDDGHDRFNRIRWNYETFLQFINICWNECVFEKNRMVAVGCVVERWMKKISKFST